MSKDTSDPAFPVVHEVPAPAGVARAISVDKGVSMRDYFATKMPTDEITEINFKHLSRVAMEYLAGRPHPSELKSGATLEETAQHHIDRVKFYCAVSAAIRYLHADAMLAERSKI